MLLTEKDHKKHLRLSKLGLIVRKNSNSICSASLPTNKHRTKASRTTSSLSTSDCNTTSEAPKEETKKSCIRKKDRISCRKISVRFELNNNTTLILGGLHDKSSHRVLVGDGDTNANVIDIWYTIDDHTNMKKKSRLEAQEWRRMGYTILLNDTYSYPRNDVQDYLNAFVQLPDRYNRRGLERQCSKKHGDQRSEIKSNAKYIVLTTQAQYREQHREQQQQQNDNNTSTLSSDDDATYDMDIQEKLALCYESASHDAKVFAHRMGKADETEVNRLQKQETERHQKLELFQQLRQDQQRNGMETITGYNGCTTSDGEINEQSTSTTLGNTSPTSFRTQEDLIEFDHSELVEYILEANGIPSPYVHRMGNNPSMFRQRRLSNYSATSVDSFDSLRKWSHHHDHHHHTPTTVIIDSYDNQNGYHHPDIYDDNSNPNYALELSVDYLDMGTNCINSNNNHENDTASITATTTTTKATTTKATTQTTRGSPPLAVPMSRRNSMSNNNERMYTPNPRRIPISRRNSGPATINTTHSRITVYKQDTGVYNPNPNHVKPFPSERLVSRRNSGPATSNYNVMNHLNVNQNRNYDENITMNGLYRPIQNIQETNVTPLPPGSRTKTTTAFHVRGDNNSSSNTHHLSMMESPGTRNTRTVSLSHGLGVQYPNNLQQPPMLIPSSHSHHPHLNHHHPSTRRNSASATFGPTTGTSSGTARNYYRKNSFDGGGLPIGSREEYYAAIA